MFFQTLTARTENLALVESEYRLAVRVILKLFWTFLNECNLSCKIVKNCILHSKVCLIKKTAPHSTYCLPQMWCMTEKYRRLLYAPPDLLARFCKVNVLKTKKFGLIFHFGVPNATYKLRVKKREKKRCDESFQALLQVLDNSLRAICPGSLLVPEAS